MDQVVSKTAPYILADEVKGQLAALAEQYGDDDDGLRKELLARLKSWISEAHKAAEAKLISDGDGLGCARGLSAFKDELIRIIFEFTTQHVYREQNPSDAERMAIIATGGYGRGLLAPGSDIDLLFLLPYKQTALGERIAENILYVLWDLGLKVGHATRTTDQCIALARADLTIRTAMLDARLILGDAELFRDMQRRYRKEVVKGSVREYIQAKLEERDVRHQRAGESRYLVEPNIKDGKGGLRDLHTLYWLTKYTYGVEDMCELVEPKVYTDGECRRFRTCGAFLWTVRCHLHFLAGKPEERLSFDRQPEMAQRLGYADRKQLSATERFMRHYFLVAKDVGDLTRVLCSALEVAQVKPMPVLDNLLSSLTWRKRASLRRSTDFRIENNRLLVADPEAFKRDPVNIIRMYWVGDHYNTRFHPDAIRLVRRSLPLIDDKLRNDPTANRLFLELLTSRRNPEFVLRRMNEDGVLGRFIPDFARIVSMMQYNMYHHFTVDEHLLRAIGILTDIENGKLAAELPLASEIIHTIQNRTALYVAVLLHDMGKGRSGDHSKIGGKIASSLCPRLGLSASETETVVWLVENHLVMSNDAQSRDLNDPKTIRSFANIVQSRERLKLLMILTATDIRAVGPGVWNGWKGQLLRTLYYETEPVVAGGYTHVSETQRVVVAQQKLREALSDWPTAEVDRFIARHYPAYWLKFDHQQQVEQARLLRDAEAERRKLVTTVETDAFTAMTTLTVLAPNYPRLLSMIAGACAAAGANIIGAQVSTTRDGLALDSIALQREFEREEDERRRGKRIAKSIEKLLRGDTRPHDLLEHKQGVPERMRAFTVEPQVIIDNALSDELTVIEINGLDRPGLLFELTQSLSDLSLDITSAHITTFGEKAVDVFYVTDLMGKKITDLSRQQAIRARLHDILSGQHAAAAE